MPASSRILSCSHGILSSTSYLPAARFVFHKKPLCLWKTVQILFRQYRIILSADTASEVRQMLSQKRR